MAYDFKAPELARPACVTIGNFDGVHIGHQSLLGVCKGITDYKDLDLVAITFWPHPRVVLQGPQAHKPLSSRARRMADLKRYGVDHIIEIPFNRELAELSPDEFAEKYLAPLNIVEFTIGHDFTLGKNRQGNAAYLIKIAARYGFTLRQTPRFLLHGEVISSTAIRQYLAAGEARKAAALLGHWHTVCGKVAHGFGRGRGLGFPTANLTEPDAVLPGNGVYACFVAVEDKIYQAVVNIGNNPTFGNADLSVEAFLLDANENLYGQEICIRFVERLRGEVKFDSPQELIAQINIDVAQARLILKDSPPYWI